MAWDQLPMESIVLHFLAKVVRFSAQSTLYMRTGVTKKVPSHKID